MRDNRHNLRKCLKLRFCSTNRAVFLPKEEKTTADLFLSLSLSGCKIFPSPTQGILYTHIGDRHFQVQKLTHKGSSRGEIFPSPKSRGHMSWGHVLASYTCTREPQHGEVANELKIPQAPLPPSPWISFLSFFCATHYLPAVLLAGTGTSNRSPKPIIVHCHNHIIYIYLYSFISPH